MPDNVDPKLLEAISFFEKMLETMPDDRTGLEFLAVAYEQTGEVEKQISTLAKLSEVLLKEDDFEHAGMIVEKLRAFSDHPQAQMAAKVAGSIIAKGSGATASRAAPGDNTLFFEESQEPESNVVQLDVQQGNVQAWGSEAAKSEMEIVWHWKDNEILPKEICMDLLHIFMDQPVSDVATLVSALGLLDEQHPEYTTTAFEDLQTRSGMPPIPLELFEASPAVVSQLPVEYIKIKGVIPFANMGAETLVGLMNPLNQPMQTQIEKITGRTCHFYLVHPAAWSGMIRQFFEGE